MAEWRASTKQKWIEEFADKLGVIPQSLQMLGAAWSGQYSAWAFPMKTGYGEPVGIRLRTNDGKKFAVTGSHSGLFIPDMTPKKELIVTEGPTDCAAALSIGLFAIGRPACLGCEDMTNDFIRGAGISRVIIASDSDSPGQRGAEKLQSALRVPSIILNLPAKDLRQSVIAGLTGAMVGVLSRDQVWTLPGAKA